MEGNFSPIVEIALKRYRRRRYREIIEYKAKKVHLTKLITRDARYIEGLRDTDIYFRGLLA